LGAALIPAHATNGYFSHGYGIKAKGMGGAGVALAQDGFAGANNPAQSAFAGNRYDVGVDLFMPEREMERTGSQGGQGDVQSKSDSEYFLIPEFGYNNVINDRLSMGLTVYGNGGMNTDYNDDGRIMGTPGKLGVDLMQLIIAPTLAFKLNPQHSVGVSPLIVYQTFKAEGLQAFDDGQTRTSSEGNVTNNGKDSSSGLGVRFGYLGKLTDQLSLGASYSPKINMSRFKKYEGLFAEQGDFDIPANYTLGMAFQVSPALQLALDYQRIEYGDVRSIANPAAMALMGGNDGPGFGWSDINVVKLGVQWQANDTLTIRAGYNKGDNPINNQNVSLNILAPGVIEEHLTLGATMKLDAQSEISASYVHAFSNEVTGPATPGGPGGTETIKMKQNSLGIQYSRKF
jgi:long-chain fatty acid transport protein